MFTTAGIVITTIPLLIYLLATKAFIFEPWGIVGAIDIILISYFAFNAVQALGYAIAPALWAGIGMIIAFCWGLLFFNEEPDNRNLAGIAILLLAFGKVAIPHNTDLIQLNFIFHIAFLQVFFNH